MERTRPETLKLFVVSDVEARSSLPDNQHNDGNLPGQGQSRHLRPNTLGQQSEKDPIPHLEVLLRISVLPGSPAEFEYLTHRVLPG